MYSVNINIVCLQSEWSYLISCPWTKTKCFSAIRADLPFNKKKTRTFTILVFENYVLTAESSLTCSVLPFLKFAMKVVFHLALHFAMKLISLLSSFQLCKQTSFTINLAYMCFGSLGTDIKVESIHCSNIITWPK